MAADTSAPQYPPHQGQPVSLAATDRAENSLTLTSPKAYYASPPANGSAQDYYGVPYVQHQPGGAESRLYGQSPGQQWQPYGHAPYPQQSMQ